MTSAQWLVGVAATFSVALVTAMVAIVFAATMAVVTVIISAALAVWAIGFRLSQGPRLQRATARPVTLEARKVGHAWVAYGWDQGVR